MATTFEQGNFKFEVIDEKKKTVRVMRKSEYTDLSGKLIIPSEVTNDGKKYSVVEIGGEYRPYTPATYRQVPDKRQKSGYRQEIVSSSKNELRGFEDTNIIEVIIPDSVTTIGERAFYFCRNLVKIKLPCKLDIIGSEAFYCTGLTSITIPRTVKTIGYASFCASKLTSLTIENGVEEIGSDAFSQTKITKVFIPASVNTIRWKAFKISTLKEAIIDDSDGIISVDSEAFNKECKVLYKSQMGFFSKLFH